MTKYQWATAGFIIALINLGIAVYQHNLSASIGWFCTVTLLMPKTINWKECEGE